MNKSIVKNAFVACYLVCSSFCLHAMEQVSINIPQDLNQMCAQRQILKNKINKSEKIVAVASCGVISVLSAAACFLIFDNVENSTLWPRPTQQGDEDYLHESFKTTLMVACAAACFVTLGLFMKCQNNIYELARMLPNVTDARKEIRLLECASIERAAIADETEWGRVQFNQIDPQFAARMRAAHNHPAALAAPQAQ